MRIDKESRFQILKSYSYLNVSAGLVIAALMVWVLTVASAINKAANVARIKTQMFRLVR